METSREAARVAIESTIAQLKEIVPDVPFDAPVTLHAITPYSQTMQTTFGREVVHRSFGFRDPSDVVPLSSCGLPGYMLFIIGLWYERPTCIILIPAPHITAIGRSAYSQENRFVALLLLRCVTHPRPLGDPT